MNLKEMFGESQFMSEEDIEKEKIEILELDKSKISKQKKSSASLHPFFVSTPGV